MKVFLDLLKPYDSVLSKPQFNHFRAFILSLSVCEFPSINRFGELHNKDRSSLNRFLTDSPWNVEELKPVYHKQLNKILSKDSFLLIDDCISHRPYAKKVEKVNWHYDHTLGKKSLGYSIVTSVVKTKNKILPYDLKSYYRKEDCDNNKFLSKNDIAENIILSTKNCSKITTAIFDTWYSNDQVINACKDAGKHYITQIKSNRNVTINHHKNAVRSFTKSIEENEWQEFEYNADKFRIFSTSAFISKIRSVHLIFSQIWHKKSKKWGETHYLISDMINKDSQIIVEEYLTRAGIESFHREAKQNTGLEGYFLRNNRGIEKYLFLVMLTYAHLVMQSIHVKEQKTIGKMCEENKVAVYTATYEEINKHPEMKQTIFMKLAKARI